MEFIFFAIAVYLTAGVLLSLIEFALVCIIAAVGKSSGSLNRKELFAEKITMGLLSGFLALPVSILLFYLLLDNAAMYLDLVLCLMVLLSIALMGIDAAATYKIALRGLYNNRVPLLFNIIAVTTITVPFWVAFLNRGWGH